MKLHFSTTIQVWFRSPENDMKKSNHEHTIKKDNPRWYSFAESSFSEAFSLEEMTAELTNSPLFQAMRDLDVPPECLKKIEETIIESIR